MMKQLLASLIGLLPASDLLAVTTPNPPATVLLQTVLLSEQPIPGLAGEVFPSFHHPSAFIAPQINDAGQLVFRGGRSTSDGAVILTGVPGSLRLVATSDGPAPGIEGPRTVFHTFTLQDITVNDQGQVSFVGQARGPAPGRDEGIWTETGSLGLRLVAREGDLAPDAEAGAKFFEFAAPVSSNDGKLAFFAERGLNQSTGSGYWIEGSDQVLRVLARDGLDAPGFANAALEVGRVSVMPNGEVFVLGNALPRGPFHDPPIAAVWKGDAYQSLSLVFDGRDPPYPGGVDFYFEVFGQANSSGDFAAQGSLRAFVNGSLVSKTGLWVIQPGAAIRPVAVTGEQPPDTPPGAYFSDQFFRFEFNAMSQVAFHTKIVVNNEPFQRNAIFAELPGGGLRLIALENEQAPGTPPGVVFGESIRSQPPRSVFDPPAYNNSGQVAFFSELAGVGVGDHNDLGLWATDLRGVLALIAREGDAFQVAPGDFRIIEAIEFVDGKGDARNLRTGLNNDGFITFSTRFTDGSSGLFIAQVVTVPEPNSVVVLLVGVCLIFVCKRRSV